MKKKLLAALLAAVMVMALMPTAFAADANSGTCGDGVTWSYSDGVLTIAGEGAMDDYINYETDFTPWWDFREEIKAVVIEDGVTAIGQSAFEDCVNLTDVTIASSVTELGMGAFYGCTGLTSAPIPDGITTIGDAAFEGCGLTSVTIPASVTSIGYEVFATESLTSIEVADENPEFSSVDGVLFNKDQTVLYMYPTGKSDSTYSIPASVTAIGGGAFVLCANLTSIDIPDSVTEIGFSAFIGCDKLTSVTIPDGVTVIETQTFAGCPGLTSVTIPASVTSIEQYAFWAADSLTDVYYGGSESQWEEVSIAEGNDPLLSAGLHTTELPDIDFPDVNEDDWFYDDVQWAVKNGWVNGYPNGTFAPHDHCTGGEVLVLLYQAAGSPDSDAELPDNLANWWNPAALRWAMENDMIDGTLQPNASSTRAQTIYYLWQAYGAQSAGEKASFSDVDEDSPYIDALSWAVEAGIVQGYPDGTFAPNGPFERAHLVRMLHLTVDLLTGE